MCASTLIRRIRYGSTWVNVKSTPGASSRRILSYGRCFPRVYVDCSNVANVHPGCPTLEGPISWQPRRRPRQAFWSRRPFPSTEWSRCSNLSTSWATGTPKTGACGPAPARGGPPDQRPTTEVAQVEARFTTLVLDACFTTTWKGLMVGLIWDSPEVAMVDRLGGSPVLTKSHRPGRWLLLRYLVTGKCPGLLTYIQPSFPRFGGSIDYSGAVSRYQDLRHEEDTLSHDFCDKNPEVTKSPA